MESPSAVDSDWLGTVTVSRGRASTTNDTTNEEWGLSLAKSGDRYLATSGDFFMATDSRDGAGADAQLGLTSGDAGYIDPADPANLDPANSRYVRADLALCRPTTTEFALRPSPRLSRTTSTRYGAGQASESSSLKSGDICL